MNSFKKHYIPDSFHCDNDGNHYQAFADIFKKTISDSGTGMNTSLIDIVLEYSSSWILYDAYFPVLEQYEWPEIDISPLNLTNGISEDISIIEVRVFSRVNIEEGIHGNCQKKFVFSRNEVDFTITKIRKILSYIWESVRHDSSGPFISAVNEKTLIINF